MKAIILAAGRGERMRPLTDHTPKPLLQVGGKALIEWQLVKLARAGIVDVIINHAWLGEKIQEQLGDGSRFGVVIQYSAEDAALETAGGIKKALPLLGSDPFLVINADVYTDWAPGPTCSLPYPLSDTSTLAHLLLVQNPSHNAKGDFYLDKLSSRLVAQPSDADTLTYTYSGIGYYHPHFFVNVPENLAVPLGPLLRQHIHSNHISAELLSASWTDVGTPERLRHLDLQLGGSA